MCCARVRAWRPDGTGSARTREETCESRTAGPADDITFMKKVKIIKRDDTKSKTPAPVNDKPKKTRSIEGTIKDWVTERRENIDTETRIRNSKFAAWDTDAIPA